MATTLKDVGRLAGVSMKTVSNVVNDHPHVSDDVRRRVEEAIRRLGYRPNAAARALRAGRSGLLAVAQPLLEEPGLVVAVVQQAVTRGLRVVIEPLLPVRDGGPLWVDAALVSAPPPESHRDPGMPVVVLGESPGLQHDWVGMDAGLAARDATEHLVRTGRRRIAAIGACADEAGGRPQPRTLGYRQAIRRAGLRVPVGYLPATGHQRQADGYHAARALLTHEERPDAIFCFTDRLAVGAIRAVVDAGLRVPQDVAVIGLGDSTEGRCARPAPTTVAADPAVVAQQALELVVRRLDGTATAPTRIVVPHVVLARESAAQRSDLSRAMSAA